MAAGYTEFSRDVDAYLNQPESIDSDLVRRVVEYGLRGLPVFKERPPHGFSDRSN